MPKTPTKWIRLIHWNAAEAAERAARLRRMGAGWEVDAAPMDGMAALRALRASPPDAVVIDLSRLPSHGREVAITLRLQPTTRTVPLVFVGGEAEKVARVRSVLPDATYATWDGVRDALRGVLSRPSGVAPIVPRSQFAAFEGVPLAQKLGIKAGMAVGLCGGPRDLRALLGPLPEGTTLRRGAALTPEKPCDLLLWFPASLAEMERQVGEVPLLADGANVWVMWAKASSGRSTDLTQPSVRRVGLANGLVDYKVVKVDETWTGLRFTRRKPKPKG